MRNISIFFAILFIGNIFANDTTRFVQSSQGDDVEYFFDTGKLSLFAGPYTRLRFINNTLVTGMGGGGVFCWDHRYYIYGQMTSYISDVPDNDGKEMELVNYGATIGYIFFPQNKIHFSSGIQFAYNNITFHESNGLKIDDDITFFFDCARNKC